MLVHNRCHGKEFPDDGVPNSSKLKYGQNGKIYSAGTYGPDGKLMYKIHFQGAKHYVKSIKRYIIPHVHPLVNNNVFLREGDAITFFKYLSKYGGRNMSATLYLRVKLNNDFFDTITSAFLFKIIKEGCNRRIAITVDHENLVPFDQCECILALEDSFNFKLVTPLTGQDLDCEVVEYRPEPLNTRMMNLQEMLEFIMKESIVKRIDVYFTVSYDIDDLDSINISVEEFAKVLEPMIANNRSPDFYFHCILEKP